MIKYYLIPDDHTYIGKFGLSTEILKQKLRFGLATFSNVRNYACGRERVKLMTEGLFGFENPSSSIKLCLLLFVYIEGGS